MKKPTKKPTRSTPITPIVRALDQVRGGITHTWTDGGITMADDWETPVT
jgi:hypothetical protein